MRKSTEASENMGSSTQFGAGKTRDDFRIEHSYYRSNSLERP